MHVAGLMCKMREYLLCLNSLDSLKIFIEIELKVGRRLGCLRKNNFSLHALRRRIAFMRRQLHCFLALSSTVDSRHLEYG